MQTDVMHPDLFIGASPIVTPESQAPVTLWLNRENDRGGRVTGIEVSDAGGRVLLDLWSASGVISYRTQHGALAIGRGVYPYRDITPRRWASPVAEAVVTAATAAELLTALQTTGMWEIEREGMPLTGAWVSDVGITVADLAAAMRREAA
jgi:hypothetical protein